MKEESRQRGYYSFACFLSPFVYRPKLPHIATNGTSLYAWSSDKTSDIYEGAPIYLVDDFRVECVLKVDTIKTSTLVVVYSVFSENQEKLLPSHSSRPFTTASAI